MEVNSLPVEQLSYVSHWFIYIVRKPISIKQKTNIYLVITRKDLVIMR